MGLTRLEGQPEFPHADISESDAAILELILQNADIVRPAHQNAESANRAYMLSHTTFRLLANEHFSSLRQAEAFSHGITVYEAIATLTRPSIAVAPPLITIAERLSSTHRALSEEIVQTIGKAREAFEHALPRTAAVIGESAVRHYQGYQDYALSGAAVAREFEVSTTR